MQKFFKELKHYLGEKSFRQNRRWLWPVWWWNTVQRLSGWANGEQHGPWQESKAYLRGVRPHLAHDKMKQIWWVAEILKAMVLPVVMYGCESWTIKKAECRRIDAFELWCWRRLLRVPWTARRSNQSILKEISPEYSLETEAETPVLWPPSGKSWLTWKDPDAGKDWRWEEKGMTEDEMVGWHHQLNGHEFEWAPGVGDGQGSLVYCSLWVGQDGATELN